MINDNMLDFLKKLSDGKYDTITPIIPLSGGPFRGETDDACAIEKGCGSCAGMYRAGLRSPVRSLGGPADGRRNSENSGHCQPGNL